MNYSSRIPYKLLVSDLYYFFSGRLKPLYRKTYGYVDIVGVTGSSPVVSIKKQYQRSAQTH